MQSKIMQIFYGNDCLPYLDSSRQTHYPVVGSAVLAANNTTNIRFYVRDIGGIETVSWVVISKLPNGKTGYQLLTSVGYDTDLQEPYLDFDLSSYYTQVNGDLFISLKGYAGSVTFTEVSEGVYEISGDPLIQVTRPIKLPINYAPIVPMTNQLLPTELDQLIGALSEYAKTFNSIVVIRGNIADADISGYSNGQIFLNFKSDNTFGFYRKVAGAISSDPILFDYFRTNELDASLIEQVAQINNGGNISITLNETNGISLNANGYILKITPSGNILFDEEALATIDWVQTHNRVNVTSLNGTFTQEQFNTLVGYPSYIVYTDNNGYVNLYEHVADSNNGDLIFEDSRASLSNANTNNAYLSSKQIYVRSSDRTYSLTNYSATIYTATKVDELISEFKQNELTIVNTTTYPTLNDFLATTGVEGYIYLYPIDSTDLTKGYYRYIWEQVSGTYQWVSLGTTEIDLSNYYNKTETNALLGGKVDKTSSAYKLYGTNELGAQTTYTVDDFFEGNVARRDTDGSITVPLTPTRNGHATSMKYVVDNYVNKTTTIAGISLSANISSSALTDALTFATNSDIDALFE